MNPHHTGRPTTDPKQQTIKLRLNDEMRSFIEHAADAAGVSMSEYIRWLIGDAMFAYNLKEDIGD